MTKASMDKYISILDLGLLDRSTITWRSTGEFGVGCVDSHAGSQGKYSMPGVVLTTPSPHPLDTADSHYILVLGNMWNHFFVLTGIVRGMRDMLSRCAFSDSLDSSSSHLKGAVPPFWFLVCHHHHSSSSPSSSSSVSRQFLAPNSTVKIAQLDSSPWWHVPGWLAGNFGLCSSGRMNLCGLPLCMIGLCSLKPFGNMPKFDLQAQGPQSCCNACSWLLIFAFLKKFWRPFFIFFCIKVCNSSSLFTSSPSSTDSWEKDDPDHELCADRVPKEWSLWDGHLLGTLSSSGGSPLDSMDDEKAGLSFCWQQDLIRWVVILI